MHRAHLLTPSLVFCALLCSAASAAPFELKDEGLPVPVVLVTPRYPALDDGTTPSGTVIVGFKLEPDRIGPVQVRLLESDLPDRFYDSITDALAYWRFRPNGDPRSCISTIHRVALTVEFDPAFGSRIVSLVSNAQQVPLERAGAYGRREDAIAEIARVEAMMTPLEPLDLDYPFWAKADRVTGYVVVNLVIDEAGRVRDPKVLVARPPEYFEKATLKALKKARFPPPLRDGQPTRMDACFVQIFGFAIRHR